LYVANTPDNAVEFYNIEVNGDLTPVNSIPVGM